ncbi:DNA integrity scanning protein DisA nucleotide-binding domain protein [Priestia megaterium]|uniref:DNA integrity scanning protein DisA nucleotide-binding domain protein n=1 Tax=Priestia megaterium TaxID=1404 RepID=UPI002FFEA045
MPSNYSHHELETMPYNKLLRITDFNNVRHRLVNDPLEIFSNLFRKIGMEEANPNVVIGSVTFKKIKEVNYINQITIYYKGSTISKSYVNKVAWFEEFPPNHQEGTVYEEIIDFIDEETIFSTNGKSYLTYTNLSIHKDGSDTFEYRSVLIEHSTKFLFSNSKDLRFYDFLKYITHQNVFGSQYVRDDMIEDYAQRLSREWINYEIVSYRYNLYERIHNLSLLKYEGEETKGQIMFFDHFFTAESYGRNIIELKEPISLKDSESLRSIRKLLEISQDNVFLICDGEYIRGTGVFSDNYSYREKMFYNKVFTIKFNSQGCWELRNNKGEIMLNVSYGIPSLPKQLINRVTFNNKCKKIFGSCYGQYEDCYENVWNFIEEARKQKHGTMIVINEHAQKEVQRLSRISFPIKPTLITDLNLIHGLTSIDGAVMLDPTGHCHAIGCILDGVSHDDIGNSSRGARFNSALRYINYCVDEKMKVLVVIVSEDGMIDIKTKDNLFE